MGLLIEIVESHDDSETDFEAEDPEVSSTSFANRKKTLQSSWKAKFQHLIEFSEVILPTALHKPMKWCPVLIQASLTHSATTEEIVRNMNSSDTSLLERQLEVWKRRKRTETSKSRLGYSVYLYKYALDMFYFAFYQNRGASPEIRDQLDAAFEAQFGSTRLNHTRTLLKLYLRHYGIIEDFHTVLPEIFRSETLAGLICDYLNPLEKGVVEEKINELLFSPHYHENQITLMLLTKDNCSFKHLLLECMLKYVVTDPLGMAEAATSATATSASKMKSSTSTEVDKTRYRMKLLMDSEPDLLVKACLVTDNFPTSLFDIIVSGLDMISKEVTQRRLQMFEDFRPPLFNGSDYTDSLPIEYLNFFRKLKETPSQCALLERLKRSIRKTGREYSANASFWIELFSILYT